MVQKAKELITQTICENIEQTLKAQVNERLRQMPRAISVADVLQLFATPPPPPSSHSPMHDDCCAPRPPSATSSQQQPHSPHQHSTSYRRYPSPPGPWNAPPSSPNSLYYSPMRSPNPFAQLQPAFPTQQSPARALAAAGGWPPPPPQAPLLGLGTFPPIGRRKRRRRKRAEEPTAVRVIYERPPMSHPLKLTLQSPKEAIERVNGSVWEQTARRAAVGSSRDAVRSEGSKGETAEGKRGVATVREGRF